MTKDKTICFFNSAKMWGGGEKWHYETALLMHKNGYRVLVITSPQSPLQKRLPKEIACETVNVENLSYLNFFKVNRLKNIFLKYRVGTVVFILSEDLKLAGLAAKLANVERIIYSRGNAIPIKNHFVNRYYFKNVLTDVLANSQATKRTILQNNPFLISENKIKIIYRPIDIKEFTNRPYEPVYSRANNDIILVNLGRLSKEKNQKFLIDVAVKLKEKNIPFRLYIAGGGDLEEDLKNYVVEKNISQRVIFTGFLRNVKDVLADCDIFLLPSLWEGFGYVLAEAAVLKKPIVAFNTTSVPEVVVNNESGFLTTLNNIEEFYDRIIELYHHPDLRKAFGNRGFEYIQEKFSAEKIEQQLLDYLSK